MSFKKYAIITLIVLLAGKLLEPLLFLLSFERHKASAIGIIGGVDGPTSIFLASKLPISLSWILIYGVILVLYFPLKHLMKART